MELFLFTTNLNCALRAQKAGLDGVIVDWENKGKYSRQNDYPVEINADSPEDVARLAAHIRIPIVVRINEMGEHTPDEVELALAKGAHCLMLPMSTTVQQVRDFLDIVDHRSKTIVQIETPALVEAASELKKLDWDYVYIGLNDLMIARKGVSIWEAVVDGTVEKLCKVLEGRKYGFGGVTVLGGGDPIPFELLLHELVRLRCGLSFLRRTFKKDILDRDMELEMRNVRNFIEASLKRGPQAQEYDRQRFFSAIYSYHNSVSPLQFGGKR